MYALTQIGICAPRWQARLEDWAKDKRGVAAVEFAMIATPFFFLIFGLLEVSVLFIMSTVLEHATSEASRQIRTGQLQQGGFGQIAFKTMICDELYDMLQCGDKLRLDVKVFSDFTTTTDTSVIDEDGELDAEGFDFSPGDPNEIVVVRVFYEWDLITPILSAPLANMSGDRRLLQATVAFRNEPYGG
ncbi:MAG: TadE/TadG family type IV pilus assembly protein [Hyphomonadaceae bacterium]